LRLDETIESIAIVLQGGVRWGEVRKANRLGEECKQETVI
jgi:hypothetical protein